MNDDYDDNAKKFRRDILSYDVEVSAFQTQVQWQQNTRICRVKQHLRAN